MDVLVEQALFVDFDQMPNLDCLGDHCGDDRQEFGPPLIVSIRFVPQIDAERADRFSVDQDRDADETQLLVLQSSLPYAQTVEKQGLSTDLRHDDGLARLG